MYRTCLFCGADLGANEALEAFPVGRRVAFDAWKGRLWAVCSRCARWNLAPIEERWEAIETADRLFTDSRLRVQSENVGLAKLRDGTTLIRIGEALPGELAAWRYGDQLVSRRNRYLVGAGAAAVAGGVVVVGGLAAGVSLWALYWGYHLLGENALRHWREGRPVTDVAPEESGEREAVKLRQWHLAHAFLAPAAEGEGFDLHLPSARMERPGTRAGDHADLVLRGGAARSVLGRAMVRVNRKGASRDHLRAAVGLLEGAGTAEAYLQRAAQRRLVLGTGGNVDARALTPHSALALEMALHDEQERRALQGQLAGLEAAWREAEEIAGIADALPDDPLDRLHGDRPEEEP